MAVDIMLMATSLARVAGGAWKVAEPVLAPRNALHPTSGSLGTKEVRDGLAW